MKQMKYLHSQVWQLLLLLTVRLLLVEVLRGLVLEDQENEPTTQNGIIKQEYANVYTTVTSMLGND